MKNNIKPPYFPFYPNDFTSSGKVEVMNTKAIGAYILLLCKAWHEDIPASIPNNDLILSKWTRLKPQEWRSIKSSVLAAFILRSDNRYYQPRLEQEYKKFLKLYKNKVESGKKGAKLRWHKDMNSN